MCICFSWLNFILNCERKAKLMLKMLKYICLISACLVYIILEYHIGVALMHKMSSFVLEGHQKCVFVIKPCLDNENDLPQLASWLVLNCIWCVSYIEIAELSLVCY